MLVFDENDLYFAVFFEKVKSKSLGFDIYLPKKAMLGRVNDEKNVFTELVSGVKSLHLLDIKDTDISYGFELCVSISDITLDTDAISVEEALHNLWEFYDGNVCFYASVDNELAFVCKEKEEFYQEFGLDFRNKSVSELNQLLEDYVVGKLTTDLYYKKVYRKDNIINLFPRK